MSNIRKDPEKIKDEFRMIFEKRKKEGTLGQVGWSDKKREGIKMIPVDPDDRGMYIGLIRNQKHQKNQEKKNIFYNFFKKIFKLLLKRE